MAEYIEREAVMEIVKRTSGDYAAAWAEIRKLPEADVTPVRHGRWIWYTEDVYICTYCGEKSHVKEVMERPAWDWCPACGAQMGGDAEDA